MMGVFINLVMMQPALSLSAMVRVSRVENSYTIRREELRFSQQLNGGKNVIRELEENGNLMLVKYYLKTDRNGNKIDSWCHEIWKRVEILCLS